MTNTAWNWPTRQLAMSEQLAKFLDQTPDASVYQGTQNSPKAVEMFASVGQVDMFLVLSVTDRGTIYGSVDMWKSGPGRKGENTYLCAEMSSVDEVLADLKRQYDALLATPSEPSKPNLRLVQSNSA